MNVNPSNHSSSLCYRAYQVTAVVAVILCALSVVALTQFRLSTTVYYACLGTAGFSGLVFALATTKVCCRYFGDKKQTVEDLETVAVTGLPGNANVVPDPRSTGVRGNAVVSEQEGDDLVLPPPSVPIPVASFAATHSGSTPAHLEAAPDDVDGQESDGVLEESAALPVMPLSSSPPLAADLAGPARESPQSPRLQHELVDPARASPPVFTHLAVRATPDSRASGPTLEVIAQEDGDSGHVSAEKRSPSDQRSPSISDQGAAAAACVETNRTKFHDSLVSFKGQVPPGIFDRPRSYAASWVISAASCVLGAPQPGQIQQRLYQHLLEGLLNAMLSGLGCRPERLLGGVGARCSNLQFELGDKYKINFKALRKQLQSGALAPDSFQAKAVRIFDVLIFLGEPGSKDYARMRADLFELLDQAYVTQEYRIYLETGEKGDHSWAIDALQLLGHVMFTAVPLQDYAEDVFQTKVRGSDAGHPAEANVLETLEREQKAISGLSSEDRGDRAFTDVNKLKGQMNEDFNPLAENNFAHHVSDIKLSVGEEERKVALLRFGTPTQQKGGHTALTGAFLLCLDYCVENNLSFFSVQLQNRDPKAANNGDESARINQVLQLASPDSRYAKVLHVMALPQDDIFFRNLMHNGFEELQEAQTFKAVFLERIFGLSRDEERYGRSLFHLPLSLEDQQAIVARGKLDLSHPVVQDLSHILDQVHGVLYGGKDKLTELEQHTFQNHVYSYLVLYFAAYHEAVYMHCQCKDAMDRAMALVGLMLYNGLMQMGQHCDQEQVQKWLTTVQFPALAIKGIRMHGERYRSFCASLKQNQQLNTEVLPREFPDMMKDMVHIRGGALKVAQISPAYGPGRTLEKLPAEANSIEEYRARISQLASHVDPAVPVLSRGITIHPSAPQTDAFYQKKIRTDFMRDGACLFNGQPLDIKGFLERFVSQREDKWCAVSKAELSPKALLDKEQCLPQLVKICREIEVSSGRFPADPVVLKWMLEGREELTAENKTLLLETYKEVYFHAILEATTNENMTETRQFLYQSAVADLALTSFSCYVAQCEGAPLANQQYGAMTQKAKLQDRCKHLVPYYNIVRSEDRVFVESYFLEVLELDSKHYYLPSRIKIDVQRHEAVVHLLPPTLEQPAHYRLFGGGSTEAIHGSDGDGFALVD